MGRRGSAVWCRRWRGFGVERLESRRLLATLTVNTTADESAPDATLSLREAISVVNKTLPLSSLSSQEQAQVQGALSTGGAGSAPDTIAFDIPGSGTQTIVLNSPLPTLAVPVTIDGTTQPGYSASGPPLVVLDGSHAGPSASGLTVKAATAVTIQGLGINAFAKGIDFLADGAASTLSQLSFSGNTTAAIAAEGNLAGSALSSILVLGGSDGIAVAGNLGTSTFSTIVVAGAAHDGITIGGTAIGSTYSNVSMALGSGSGDGIHVQGDASNSMFTNVAVTGAGGNGMSLGVASGSKFTNIAVSNAGSSGIVINGAATSGTYSNVAIALGNGSKDGFQVVGDGSNSSYSNLSVVNAGVDGVSLGAATGSSFTNIIVSGAGHDGVFIQGDGSSSTYHQLVLVLNSGANTGFAVAGSLSTASISRATISGLPGTAQQFGSGISVGNSATGSLFNAITISGTFGLGIGVVGDVSNTQFHQDLIEKLAATTTPSVGLGIRGAGVQITNSLITGALSDGIEFLASSGAVSMVASNIINTSGTGVGILLQGGAGSQVAVGCNNLSGDAVGAKILGDGTTAGTIDLGGGSLGSMTVMTGQNTFDQTVAAGTTAISLTQTGAGAVVDALGNAFADLTAIQDGTHGGGTGMVAVSQGTANCPGTVAILMGTFTVPEGTIYNGPVATYTIQQPVSAGPFTATIDWGDTTTSTGTITQPGGAGTPFVVSGTHTYTTAGVYVTSVTVHDASTDYVAPGPGTAIVTAPAPVVTVPPLAAAAGVPTGSVPVATFTVSGTALPASQYMAVIDWGDGTPPVLGTVTQSGTTYTVTGGHTYAQAGTDTITVTVQAPQSVPGVGTGPATVSGMSVKQPTTTTMGSPLPNPAAFGTAVTFTAFVVPTAGGATPPVGELVTFSDGTTTLGTAPLDATGAARFVTSTLPPGIHQIAAQYPGDANFAPSTSTTVTQAVLSPPVLAGSTTQLASSANPALAGQAVTFTAVVAAANPAAGIPTGTVTFVIDGVAQTPVTLTVVAGSDMATFTSSTLSIGAHSVTAVYNGDPAFASSSSSTLTQMIQPATAPPTVVALQRYGFHAMPTSLVLTFSTALDPTRAMTLAEYQVVALIKGRKGRIKIGPAIAVTRAAYNATNYRVTLSLARRLNVHNLYQLTVNGTPPNGLTDTYGQFLAGAKNGQAGTNYVRIFGADVLTGPASSG